MFLFMMTLEYEQHTEDPSGPKRSGARDLTLPSVPGTVSFHNSVKSELLG